MTINFYQSARAMRNGGSFAASIGEAYFCADSNNQTILTTAFYSLFKRFDPAHESDADSDDVSDQVLEFLNENTTVIGTTSTGSIVYADF